MSVEEEELEFLRDQVYRLNSALAFYQAKFPSSGEEEKGLYPPRGISPSWLADKRLLSPLITEYDSHIKNLTKQISAHEEEEKHFGNQIQKLIEENQRLTRELKEQVQLQLDALNDKTRNETNGSQSTGLKYQEVVDNLQEQLAICLREKDHVDNLLQDALAECDRLRAVGERGLQPIVDDLERQCNRKIESVGRSIVTANTELNRSKLKLNEKQLQLDTLEEENRGLRKDLERLKLHLDQRMEELEINGSGNKDLQSLTEAQEEVIQKLTMKNREMADELNDVSAQHQQLTHSSANLQDKIIHLESLHASALEQVKSNVQLVENVLLEKDRAVIRVKQLEEETLMLKSSLEELVAEAGTRTKREVEEIRSESAVKLKQLSDFVSELEDELRVKTNQVERLKRQIDEENSQKSRKLEYANEIDVCGPSASAPASAYSTSSSVADNRQTLRDELHWTRLTLDEAKLCVEETKKATKTLAESHEMERRRWREKEEKMNLYIEDLIGEADKARAENVDVATQKKSALEEVHRLRSEVNSLETRLTMCDSSTLESLAEKEASIRSRLDAAEETHKNAINALRGQLSRKDDLVEELRKEIAKLNRDVASVSSSLKSDRELARQRLAQLSVELREEKARKVDAETALDKAETKARRGEERRKAAEEAKTSAARALVDNLQREKLLLETVGKMEKEIERLDLSRVAKNYDALLLTEKKENLHYRLDLPHQRRHHSHRLKEGGGGVVAGMSEEELSEVKMGVDEDLKKMFRVEDYGKRKKKIG